MPPATPPSVPPDRSTVLPGLAVLKFGGTSVATAPRWVGIAQIVRRHRSQGRRVLLVCSAAGATSDLLVQLVDAAEADDPAVEGLLADLRARHLALADDLGVDGNAVLDGLFADLFRRVEGIRLLREASPRSRAAVMALGELMSTRLGAAFLGARGLATTWLDARTLLQSTGEATEGQHFLSATCDFAPCPETAARVAAAGGVAITQGFIAADAAGHTVLLGRGGSDTSAAYLAARLGAAALEIWTDVPGLFTADPRKVAGARHLTVLSYRQAESLSALGARVLHPRSIQPAREAGIPVWVRSTLNPALAGTRIVESAEADGVKAVLSRGDIALVTATRPARWQSVGFIAEVSACFQEVGVPIDLFAASPAAIQATIDLSAVPDADAVLAALEARLSAVCAPTIEHALASLSLVGSRIHEQLDRLGLAYGALEGVSPRLVVHGADDTHVTLVLQPADVPPLARALHRELLEQPGPAKGCGVPWSELAPRGAAPVAAEAR